MTPPHSKARVIVPMYEYWNAVPGYEGVRRGTLPDVAGVDEQLDAALKLAR